MWGGSLGLLQKPHLALLPSNTSTALTLSSGGTYSVIFCFPQSCPLWVTVVPLYSWVLNSWQAISCLALTGFLTHFLQRGALSRDPSCSSTVALFCWGSFFRVFIFGFREGLFVSLRLLAGRFPFNLLSFRVFRICQHVSF